MKTVYFVPDLGYMADFIGTDKLNYVTSIIFDKDGFLVTIDNDAPIIEKMGGKYEIIATRE